MSTTERAAASVARVLAAVLAMVVAVVSATVALTVAPAAAVTAPPAATFVKCTDKGPTAAVYTVIGGAVLHVSSWQDFGYNISGGPSAPTPTQTSCRTRPVVPATGTFVRGVTVKRNSAGTVVDWQWTGPTYEIVGGAPLTVHAWANVGGTGTVRAVDNTVLAALVTPGAACPSGFAGCLDSRPATGTAFAGYSTTAKAAATFYRIDSVDHPVPQVSATAGEKVVDQTSINACERMDCDPSGQIVNATSNAYGRLHVDGIAMDYPSPDPVVVHLEVGGQGFDVPANQPTDADLPSIAGDHGFSADLPVPWSPSLVLCGTVLGRSPGATTSDLGCSAVSVLGAAPGRVHRPTLKAKGHHRVKVTWSTPATNGSSISAYLVKTSTGKRKQVSGSTHHLLLKHLPGGRRITVRIRAINGVGYGSWSKKSKSVRVR